MIYHLYIQLCTLKCINSIICDSIRRDLFHVLDFTLIFYLIKQWWVQETGKSLCVTCYQNNQIALLFNTISITTLKSKGA